MAIEIAAIPIDDRYRCQPPYEYCDVWLPVLEARGCRGRKCSPWDQINSRVRLQVLHGCRDVKAEAGTGKTHKLSMSRGVIPPMTTIATNR